LSLRGEITSEWMILLLDRLPPLRQYYLLRQRGTIDLLAVEVGGDLFAVRRGEFVQGLLGASKASRIGL
jgi:hypothetical protein